MHDRYNITLNHFRISKITILSFSKIQKRSKVMQSTLYRPFETILDLMKIGMELIESETIQITIFTTHAFFALSARVLLSGCVIVKYRSTAIVPSANIELKVD